MTELVKAKECAMDAEFEPLDEELKKILANRYEDVSEFFTPEACRQRREQRLKAAIEERQRRRSYRLRVTLGAAAFMMAIIIFCVWAWGIGWFSPAVAAGCIAAAGAVAGYNVGICICYNHGCWGSMV